MAFKLPTNLPEISQFTKMLMGVEGTFEKSIRQTGLSLPKGPQSQILTLQRQIEAGRPLEPPTSESLNLPKQLQLPNLQNMPPLPGQNGSESSSSTNTSTPTNDVTGATRRSREAYIAGASRDRRRTPDDPAIF